MEKTIIISKLKIKMKNQLGIANEDFFIAIFVAISVYYATHAIFIAVLIMGIYLLVNHEIADKVTVGELIKNLMHYYLMRKEYEVEFNNESANKY